MRDAAAEGSAHSDRQMRDVVRDRRQQHGERAWRHRLLEHDVTGEGADAKPIAFNGEPAERIDAIDVDEHGRSCQPEIHRRHEALTAGEHPGVPAMLGKERQRFVERPRCMILEGRWFHR